MAAVDSAKVTVSSVMRSLMKRSASEELPPGFPSLEAIVDRKMEAECRLFGTNESLKNLEVSLHFL